MNIYDRFPLPWRIESCSDVLYHIGAANLTIITTVVGKEAAEAIVHAVNTMPELVEALVLCVASLESAGMYNGARAAAVVALARAKEQP